MIDMLDLYEYKDKDVLLERTALLCKKYGLLSWQSGLVTDENELMKEITQDFKQNYKTADMGNSLFFCLEISRITVVVNTLMTLYLIWKALFWEIEDGEKSELKNLLKSVFGFSFGISRRGVEEFIVNEQQTANYTIGKQGVLEKKNIL